MTDCRTANSQFPVSGCPTIPANSWKTVFRSSGTRLHSGLVAISNVKSACRRDLIPLVTLPPPLKIPAFFQNRDMSVPRPVILFGLLLTAVFGCGPESQVRQYVAKPDPGQEQKILTTELIRGRFQKGGGSAKANIPFRWVVPQSWTAAAQDQFSQFAWNSGPGQSVRITVTGLPGTAGIGAQFVRWGGQIDLDTSDPAALLKKVEELSLGGAQGQWIELKGPSDTILGMIVPHGDMLWVVKLKGENSAAAEVRASFRQFCESWQAG